MAQVRAVADKAGDPPPHRRASILAGVVIVVMAVLAYANSFQVPFVFDDELAIVSNPSLRSLATAWFPPPDLTGLPISGRPVVNFSFGLSHAISADNVWSYHAANLLIHIVAALFLFGIVSRTFRLPALASRFGARAYAIGLVSALLWMLHPLQTESVTYISQRAEALLGLFYLGTVWCFIRAVETGASSIWGWGAVLACTGGMATKEVMASAPLFLAIYCRAFYVSTWRDVWVRHGRLLLAVASTWLLLLWFVVEEGGARGVSAGFGLGVSSWSYLLTQCEAIVLYLKLSLWPHPLVLDYGTGIVHFATEVWWRGLLLLTLCGGTSWALFRKPVLGCLGAWFFMILAPSSSVIPLVGQTMAEHRMYLPLAAVIVPAVAILYLTLGRTAMMVSSVIVIVFGVTTSLRNADYASTIHICEDTVAKRPGNARAMALLADYYHRAGRLDQARHWLERSLAVQPGVRPVLNNLGNVWQELGEPDKAVSSFQHALALKPNDPATLNNLGNALILSGRAPEGIAQLEAALRIAPTAMGTRVNLAHALAQAGRLSEAAIQFEKLVTTQPADGELRAHFGHVLIELGRGDEGIAQLQAAARLQPRDADLHNALGTALGRAGRIQEALDQFQEALRLNPAHESARQNAALARRRLGGP